MERCERRLAERNVRVFPAACPRSFSRLYHRRIGIVPGVAAFPPITALHLLDTDGSYPILDRVNLLHVVVTKLGLVQPAAKRKSDCFTNARCTTPHTLVGWHGRMLSGPDGRRLRFPELDD